MRPDDFFAGKPVASLQTMLRTIAQWDGSLPPVVPDGIYGEQTKRTVMEFQRQHGLPQTGVTDWNTWSSIVPVFQTAQVNISEAAPLRIQLRRNQVFLRGSQNRHVLLIQAMLRIIAQEYDNFPAPELTGVYDDATVASVKALQTMNCRETSGIFDKDTWQVCTSL